MTRWLVPAVGVLLLLLLMRDVHGTVFVPRGRAGPLARRLYAGTWWLAQRAAGPRARPRARRWLSSVGPLLVPGTFILWGSLLVAGFAGIFHAFADRFVPAEVAAGLPRWATALYFSGYAATTLGVGDVYPAGAALRFVAVLEAAMGFALFSITITYLLAVYGALSADRALALEVSRYIGSRGEPAAAHSVIAAHQAGEDDVVMWLQQVLPRLGSSIVSKGQYPLLYYFHTVDDERALPLALGELLELLTIARTLLSPDSFPRLASGATSAAALALARESVVTTLAATTPPPRLDDGRAERAREARFRMTADALRRAGVPMRDEAAAWQRYRECRAGWDEAYANVCSWFSYPTDV